MGLGAVGVLAAPIMLAGASEAAVLSLLALITFLLVVGWRIFRLSKIGA
jgi:hypothetical protein